MARRAGFICGHGKWESEKVGKCGDPIRYLITLNLQISCDLDQKASVILTYLP